MNSKFTTGVLITVISTAVLGIILVLVFAFGPNFSAGDNLSVIEIEAIDNSQEEVEFNSLDFYPGKSHSYQVKVKAVKTGDYKINFNFETEKVSALSDYVTVRILDDEDNVIYEELLKKALEDDNITVECSMKNNKKENYQIVYYMDSSVGNEAKNLELTLDLIISVSEKK